MAHTFPKDFSEPVLALISLGEKAARNSQWPDYSELGITSDHISELIRIIERIEEFWLDEDVGNAAESYAPIHAWRALGQLKAEQAIPSLVKLVIWNEDEDADWIMEDIPDAMGMIGPACIPPLRDHLIDPHKLTWASVTFAHCLAEIGTQHPESRPACVEALQAGLEQFEQNDETINAFIISYLADLKAVEAAPLVERAYQADVVDLSVQGDFEDWQIELGLLEKRLTPPPRYHWAADPQAEWDFEKNARREEEQRKRAQEKKAKKKQKQAKKARKGKKGKRK
ncbi:MAG: DUF1186 domain-containing protein [Anaerolineales bacterium]|nr:DUF1186 domain-containing protein [Anaerolineales bacterium]